jgi:hypothetical protein
MTKSVHTSFLILALLTAPAAAQQFDGEFDLDGRYSTRRGTSAELSITKTSTGLSVSRTARFTGWRFRNVPAFTWTSTEVTQRGRLLRVTYTLDRNGQNLGLIDHLDADRDPGSATVRDVRRTSVLRAYYRLSQNEASINELIVNVTRRSSEYWWYWIRTSGSRTTPAPTGWADKFQERGITDPSVLYHFNVDVSTLTKTNDRDAHIGLLNDPTNLTLTRIALVRSMAWEITLRYRIENGTNEGLITQGGHWRVGKVTDPNDGEEYDIVHWSDVDDGSMSVYWKNGVLYSIYHEG